MGWGLFLGFFILLEIEVLFFRFFFVDFEVRVLVVIVVRLERDLDSGMVIFFLFWKLAFV